MVTLVRSDLEISLLQTSSQAKCYLMPRESADIPGHISQFNESLGILFPAHDYSMLALKPNHTLHPLWVFKDGRIILEAFSGVAEQAQDFLIAIAEPVTRPRHIHEYRLTQFSLYAAASVGLKTQSILDALNLLSKSALPAEVVDLIVKHTKSHGKVKLLLKENRYWLESKDELILNAILDDPAVQSALKRDESGMILQPMKSALRIAQQPQFTTEKVLFISFRLLKF